MTITVMTRNPKGLSPSKAPWSAGVPDGWTERPLFAWLIERHRPNFDLGERLVLSLSFGRIVRRHVESNKGLLPESFGTYQVVEPGDIVLRLTDLQNDHRSLRTGLVTEKGIVTSAYVALGPLAGVNPRFAHYLLHALDLRKVFYTLGGGLRQTMRFADLRRMPLAFPSEDEQSTIVSLLDRETVRIDTLVAKNQRLIELLQEKRTALISHAVTKGLDSNVPMKESGVEWLGFIPAHWRSVPLKRLLRAPLQYGASEAGGNLDEDGPRFIRITDIDSEGRLRDATACSISEEAARGFLLDAGDVLFARSGATAGKTYLFDSHPERAAFAGYLIRACADRSQILPGFLRLFTQSQAYWEWVAQVTIQSTIQNVSAERYANLTVPVPPLEEQETILGLLHRQLAELDSLTSVVRKAEDRLFEYRSALITAAVTGQIDVGAYCSEAS